MSKVRKQTWRFDHPIFLAATGTVVGPLESKGPLSGNFDKEYQHLNCGEKSWTEAERALMRRAIAFCLAKAGKSEGDIDLFLAGDLMDQTVTSNFLARENRIPFLGMFGACSTSMETLAAGAQLVDSGFADNVLCAVSSHNATAERQFRYPTEYGGPSKLTQTFTVTGAGATIVTKEPGKVRVKEATIGRVIDWGIDDASNLGTAMAPAAADTIWTHFQDTGRKPEDYDMVVTGDLSSVGSPILNELLLEKGLDITNVHQDCGTMIYSPDQPVNAGGSGCACSAVVTYGYLYKRLAEGSLKRVLVVATGALLNSATPKEKDTIPCIAHAVVLESAKEGQR
ncbi:stage V sporulation protein AD [Sporolactobacillus laevolacticus]|uniref:stage V sporulation protein AD n=1 Tax=Sporolactobacillus laevolacticus TaxID=33018 RepID=UPI0025B2F02E|nr:stage V sporulation protein AD [Sporolactobacillus laevolacticus]MDN3953608.1 stage V sporulation protein AD [Sporolactobacillus laevolacticus]